MFLFHPLPIQNPETLPIPIFRPPHNCSQPFRLKPPFISLWETRILPSGLLYHSSFIKNPEIFNPNEDSKDSNIALVVWNSLLGMYSRCSTLTDLTKLFDEMPMRDTVSWNTMVSGFLRNGEFDKGFAYFKQMTKLSFCWFDRATLTTILSACDRVEFCYIVKMMHGLVFLNGFGKEITVAMISGLVQNELYEESLELFNQMRSGSVCPNSLTYLSSLTACSGLQALTEGCQIHGLLWKLGIQSELCIESSLMDMYSKCGNVNDALGIFESAQNLDEISMTVILVGLAQNGFEEEAKRFFVKMFESGTEIDPNMLSAVLGVFGEDTSLGLGLLSFARHGDGCRALQLYEEMRPEGIAPTVVTFLSLLHAWKYAANQLIMETPESSVPYVSMVNIYSTRGKWKERARTIKRMKEIGVSNGISWIEIEKKVHSFVVQDRMHPQTEAIYGVLEELLELMLDEGYVPGYVTLTRV
ncbi:hypothetical protein V6N11_045404 [Hibiscus sabdariffa]|uniref:Pentatricopeptide repeat-containing protein n=1 Tax=Hibiscus sabdariffa TaxID=183260 RepID=A0ABR2Q0U6_9ROSI